MWNQFILENVHFGLNLFVALTFFAVAWLYFDAWINSKTKREGVKVVGFLLLSISFLIHSTHLESSLLENSYLQQNYLELIFTLTRLAGYVLLIISLLEPLQKQPEVSGITKESFQSAGVAFVKPSLATLMLSFPLLSGVISVLYLRKAFFGLERHLKPVGFAFFGFTLYELFHLAESFHNTKNVDFYNLTAPFGPLWLISHGLLFISTLILSRWVFGYLLKRIQSQLFFILTTTVLAIFLLTAVVFTSLLVKSLEEETFRRLDTDVRVLNFGLDSKQIAQDSQVQLLAQ